MEYVHGAGISFKYDGQVESLLEKVDFRIDGSSRIGLVGDNGSGKTTLLDIIRRSQKTSGGVLKVRDGITIGHLPQEVRLEEEMTVRDYLWQTHADLFRLRQRLESVKPSSPDYAGIVSGFYDGGGGEFEAQIEKVIAGFDIAENKLGLPVSRLSGGEKTKVALAGLLLQRPEVMLLDEPTNHLEIASLEWLENYLRSASIPYVAVSHDRRFLDNCVDEIWELHDKNLTVYAGNYSFYKEAKELGIRQKFHKYETQQKKIRQLKSAAEQRRRDAGKMENFKLSRSVTKKGGVCKRDDGSGRSGVSSADKMRSAKAMEKRIRQMLEKEKADKPRLDRERKITFAPADLKSPMILHIEGLKKTFDHQTVLDNITLAVGKGVKLGIIGRNGSGKSTLLKIITGNLKATSGSFRWSPQAKIGYFSQEHETLNLSNTILDEVVQGRQSDQTRARTILGRLNIRRDKVYQTIGSLSLGERSKTALAKILFSDANILIFDEPTNHIELSAREAFEEALEEFGGTVIVASHDRYLLDRITTDILDLDHNRFYAGSYQDYTGRT